MDFLFFVLILGGVVGFSIALSRANARARKNRVLVDELRFDLNALRSTLPRRVWELERELADLKGAAGGEGVSRPEDAEAAGESAEAAPQQPAESGAAAAAPVPPAAAQFPPAAAQAPPATPADQPGGPAATGVESTPDQAPESAPAPGIAGYRPPPPPAAPGQTPPSGPFGGLGGINWEQWVGIRGAALLGAIVMALAGILFLQYAIEHELIPPTVRVALGFLVGIGCVAGAEKLRERGYGPTANALAGAGIVILYASVWAARVLYGLIGSSLGYGLMILVTLACGMLSWRYRARDTALLGLIGGFATPLLLSTGQDNPIGLFAYILMLNAGLFALARLRGWPVLAGLSLAATVFYQLTWIVLRMGPERAMLGLGILGMFGLFYAIAGRLQGAGSEDEKERETWQPAQTAGVLLPFAFALYFAGNAVFTPHLYPIGILLLLLSAVAGWLSRVQDFPLLSTGSASGSVAVVAVWCLQAEWSAALAWEAVGVCVVLALLFHVLFELDWRRGGGDDYQPFSHGPLITSAGFLALLVFTPLWARMSPVPFWPWLCGWIGLAALLIRQSVEPSGRQKLGLAALGVGLGFSLFYGAHRGAPGFPAAALYFGVLGVCAVAFQGLAVVLKEARRQVWANRAAAIFPATVLVFLMLEGLEPKLSPLLYLTTTILLALLIVLAATCLRSGKWYFTGMALLALGHNIWTAEYRGFSSNPDGALIAFLLQLLAVGLFSWWPLLTRTRFGGERWAWYAAALAGPAWFLALRQLYEIRFGDAAIGLLPVALAALSLGAAFRIQKQGLLDPAMHKRGLVWFSAVAMGFISVAIPLQLDKEWITLGWAIQGFALTALWKRLDHTGLKYFALALLAVVTIRLVANPEIVHYHPRSSFPFINWLMYTYLVPAAALLGSAWNLFRLEVERSSEREAAIYSRGHSVGAILCGMAAILVVFVWINLAIFDFFSAGPQLTISFEHMAARDLSQSLAWALYALLLLAIGVNRHIAGLRWISLAFLLLTIGKVFLHDLGELEDLYRVASLVGLAFSLILVSLAYQRFVFGKDSRSESSPKGD